MENNKQIKNYKIMSFIAEGGMGEVYYGEHITLNRPVAIKKLHNNLTSNPVFKDRFLNEAKILAQLNHPNIITLYDFIQEEDSFYIITEYITGDTIDNILRNQRVTIELERSKCIFSKILDAFNYAHSKGIIHRDIKPGNIMLDSNDNPKVLDFGIAKLLQGDLNLTKSGTKMGSLYYMSPEQVTGTDIDHRSDIYSLGIMYYELLTNSIPYNINTDTEFEIMNCVINQPVKNLSSFRSDIPQNISTAILKACEKNRDMRFSSCEEFKKALGNISFTHNTDFNKTMVSSSRGTNAGGFNNTIIQSNPYGNQQTYYPPKKNNNIFIFISIGGILLVAFILVIFLVLNSNDDSGEVITNKKKNSQNTESKGEEILKSSPKEERQAPPERKYTGTPGEYPEGSDRYLTDDELRSMSKYSLSIMRNEIFARHGYIFKSNPVMIDHFNAQPWYTPQYYDVTYMLTAVEKANVNKIKFYEGR